jgi:bile acid:Na+ symporter, BASS family
MKIVIAIVLIALMFQAGLLTDSSRLLSVLRDYPRLIRAIVASMIVVPVVGVAIVHMLALSPEIATGVTLMALAPGVPFVVASGGKKHGGSQSLAVALAFIMQFLAIFFVPLAAKATLPVQEAGSFHPLRTIVTLLVLQLVPLVAGIAISNRAPALAERMSRPVSLIFVIALLVVLISELPEIARAFATTYGSRGTIASVIIVLLSLLTGWALGGPEIEYRRTTTIATALRNFGICLAIANASFPDTVVGPAVIVYLIVQLILCGLTGAFFTRSARPAHA